MRLGQGNGRTRPPSSVLLPLRKINCLFALFAVLAVSSLFHPTTWNEHAVQVVVVPSPSDLMNKQNHAEAVLGGRKFVLEKTTEGLHSTQNKSDLSISKQAKAAKKNSASNNLTSRPRKDLKISALSEDPVIPRRLIFTHKTNLLDPHGADSADRTFFLPNIFRTIYTYAVDLWQEKHPVDVWFLNNTDCLQILQRVEPRLVPHFQNEKEGKYKGDLCRMAALFLKGGYYVDVDMKAIKPVALEPSTTFASVNSTQGFFNSFVAAKPRNPIIYYSLQLMLRFYQNRTGDFEWKGSDLEYRMGDPPEYDDEFIILGAMERIRAVGLIGPFTLGAAYEAMQWRHWNGNFSQNLRTFRTSDTWSNVSRKKYTDYNHFGEFSMFYEYHDERGEEGDPKDEHKKDDDDDDTDDSQDKKIACSLYSALPECSEYYSQMDELWDEFESNKLRTLPHINFTQLLREEDLGDKRNKESRKKFPHLPYQDEGQGPNCNWVVRDDDDVYFLSRIIGTGKDHCDFPKNQSRPTRLPPGRQWSSLPSNVRLFKMGSRKDRRQKKALKTQKRFE